MRGLGVRRGRDGGLVLIQTLGAEISHIPWAHFGSNSAYRGREET